MKTPPTGALTPRRLCWCHVMGSSLDNPSDQTSRGNAGRSTGRDINMFPGLFHELPTSPRTALAPGADTHFRFRQVQVWLCPCSHEGHQVSQLRGGEQLTHRTTTCRGLCRGLHMHPCLTFKPTLGGGCGDAHFAQQDTGTDGKMACPAQHHSARKLLNRLQMHHMLLTTHPALPRCHGQAPLLFLVPRGPAHTRVPTMVHRRHRRSSAEHRLLASPDSHSLVNASLGKEQAARSLLTLQLVLW